VVAFPLSRFCPHHTYSLSHHMMTVGKRHSLLRFFVASLCIIGSLCALSLSGKPVDSYNHARSLPYVQTPSKNLSVSTEAVRGSSKKSNETTKEAAEEPSIRPTIGVVSSCLLSKRFDNSTSKQSLRNKQDYCDRHDNVYCYLHSESLDGRFSAHWNKFPLVERALQTNDFAIWMDCDALFINMSATFEEAGIFSERKDLILTSDNNGINTGVFVVRKTDWTVEFLSLMYEQRGSVDYFNTIGKGPGFVDQTGLKILRDKYYSTDNFENHSSLEPKFTSSLNNYCTTGTFIHHRVNCNSQECNAYFTCVTNQIQSGSGNLERCAAPQHLKNLCAGQKKCCQAPEGSPQRANTLELPRTSR